MNVIKLSIIYADSDLGHMCAVNVIIFMNKLIDIYIHRITIYILYHIYWLVLMYKLKSNVFSLVAFSLRAFLINTATSSRLM